ncbi:MAG: sigma 54-interacting transcriptional regulator [Polyangiaceae bacterium]
MQAPRSIWIDEAQTTVDSPTSSDKLAASFRLTVLLAAAGRDEEADRIGSEMRRAALRSGAGKGWSEVALAWIALSADNDAGVHAHVSAARAACALERDAASARSWIDVIAMMHARRLGGDAQEEIAQALSDAEDAIRLENKAHSQSLIRLEQGWTALAADDLEAARANISGAIDDLEKAGMIRDAGRAMIAWAEALAVRGDATSASWLARAQTLLGKTATWRDRIQLHRGFIARGRRIIDRVMSDPAASRVEAFERARGAAVAAIANAVDLVDASLAAATVDSEKANAAHVTSALDRVQQATFAVRASTGPAIVGLDRVARDLVDLVGAALVERERLHGLLDAFGEIDGVTDRAELPRIVAALLGRMLECDRVVVALVEGGEYRDVAHWGENAESADFRGAIAKSIKVDSDAPARRKSESPAISRAEGKPRGAELVVPIRSGALRGAIYVDKLKRSGQFRDEDFQFASVVAESFALARGRLDAREQERSLHQKLTVTTDAIQEGLVACDENGVVTTANAAAARMLRVPTSELVGMKLERNPSLGPLAAQLARNPRLDGTVVRLAHASFVVSSRPMSTSGTSNGFVATLVELERAQKIAQKVTATRSRYTFRDVVGDSPPLRAAVAVAMQATTIDANVLITGESGTGKEVVAQAIHSAGPRSQEPFVGINCAALPHDLLEAELFGYERGAFTGARAEGNVGKFELAAGGSILLDEIGDMPLGMQAKLLRVLQERVVTRLGGSSERPVEARVIATTHRDLEQLVSEGKFRLDLLFRLRVLSIELPPLRERSTDIALLAQGFVLRFAEQQNKSVREIAPNVLSDLAAYAWPGNVRELANVIESEVSLASSDATVLTRISSRLGARTSHWSLPPAGEFPIPSRVPASLLPSIAPSGDAPILPLVEVEKRAFLHALAKCDNNVARAAEALGVSKVTFYAKLRGWHLHPKDRESSQDVSPPSSSLSSSESETRVREGGSSPPPTRRSSD